MTPEELRAREQAALDNCEQEPIALVGTVQPFGWLLATDLELSAITHVSENVTDFTGRSLDEVLGADPGAVLDRTLQHKVRNVIGHRTIREVREHVGRQAVGSGVFDVAVHRSADAVILEFTAAAADDQLAIHAFSGAQLLLTRSKGKSGVEALLDHVVRELHDFTGYDRVLAYRFLPDGAGEVIAEAREHRLESLLGLRFPAFDIPQSARKLYAATPIRVIASVVDEQAAIRAADDTSEPLDLSLALLRGTVPVHSQYLGNMGVAGSMSLPLVVDGEMWGLLSLHHSEPKAPSAPLAMACELVGRSVSIMLQHELERARRSRLERCQSVASTMFGYDNNPLGFSSHWEPASRELASLVDCDGIALVGRSSIDRYGRCPTDETIRALVSADEMRSALGGGSAELEANPVWSTNSLGTTHPSLDVGPTAGALTVLSPWPLFDGLVFFRDETAESIRWAGAAQKDIEQTDDGIRLNPRASFAEYLETTAGQCRGWEADDIEMASALHAAFAQIHATLQVKSERQDELGLVVRELNHRVRNILAIVQSLVAQTHGHDVSEYVASLGQRIGALAGAHDLLTENEWAPIGLEELFNRSLAPYGGGAHDSVDVAGPAVNVAARAASSLSLVFHELASNAAKYGALSVPDGRVELRWRLTADILRIDWIESGGPTVVPPESTGFGTSIIKDSLAFEFDAAVSLSFEPEGLQASFGLPAALVDGVPAVNLPADAPAETAREADRTTALVLLLEDDYLVSQELEGMLRGVGNADVVAVASIEAALASIKAQSFDAAVLDVNVRGAFSAPVAEQLRRDGTPFVFVTGYGSRDQLIG